MPTSPKIFFLLATLAAAVGPAAAQPDTPRDQAREILALRSAAGQVLDEVRSRSSTQSWDHVVLTEQLAAAMVKDAGAHRRPSDSRPRALRLAEQHQRAALELALSNAVAAAQTRSPRPIRREDVLEMVGPSWTEQIEQSLAAFRDSQFEAVFAGARLRAVALQQQAALAALKYPEPAELDGQLLALWQARKDPAAVLADNDFNALEGWLKKQGSRSTGPLLEEVEQQLGDLAARRKDEVRRQYEAQRAALQERADHLPGQLLTKPAIANDLRTAIASEVEKRKRQAADTGAAVPVYPAFQIVSSNAWPTAERLEAERLTSFLEASGLPRLSADSLQKSIEREPGRHRMRADSETVFFAELRPAARAEVAAAHVKKAGAPDPVRAEVEARLAEGGSAQAIFDARLKTQLGAALETARNRVAEQQRERQLGFIPGAEPLSDALLAKVQERAGKPVADLKEGLAFLDATAEPVLEEAEARAVGDLNQAIAAGYSAMQAQAQLVRTLEATRREQLVRDVAAERPVDAVLKEWTTDFTKQWSRQAAEQKLAYEEPLAVTRDLLNKTVRQLYDAQKKDPTTLATTASPGQPSPASAALSPTENQRDEPDEAEQKAEVEQRTLEEILLVPCDASLVIRDLSENECEAVLRMGPDAEPVSVRFAPNAAEQAAQALFEGLKPSLARLVDENKGRWSNRQRNLFGFRRKQEPELRFYMVVRSREIRHQTSLLLRQQIGELLQQWTEANRPGQPVALDWTVGLGAVVGPE